MTKHQQLPEDAGAEWTNPVYSGRGVAPEFGDTGEPFPNSVSLKITSGFDVFVTRTANEAQPHRAQRPR